MNEPLAAGRQQLAAGMPNVDRLLLSAMQMLASIDSARLTAEVLLAHVLSLSRAQLLARLDHDVSAEAQAAYTALVRRAAEGEPLAYLTGQREFHGLDFVVDSRVLVPRPETELLVDLALDFLAATKIESAEQRVLDVGTGSGCIAISLAMKCPTASVTALDISDEALALARRNAERHGVHGRVSFAKSDLLTSLLYLRSEFHLLCANLPYIPSDELRALPVSRHEPALALDGGPDGLLWIRRLLATFGRTPRVLSANGAMLLEIGAAQGPTVAALCRAAFPNARVDVHVDYAGLDRVVSVRMAG